MAHSSDTSERKRLQRNYGLGYAKSGIRNEFNASMGHTDGKIKLYNLGQWTGLLTLIWELSHMSESWSFLFRWNCLRITCSVRWEEI